jgi:hypothetical protein
MNEEIEKLEKEVNDYLKKIKISYFKIVKMGLMVTKISKKTLNKDDYKEFLIEGLNLLVNVNDDLKNTAIECEEELLKMQEEIK